MCDDARDLIGCTSWDEALAEIERHQADFRAAEDRADRLATIIGLVVGALCVALVVVGT